MGSAGRPWAAHQPPISAQLSQTGWINRWFSPLNTVYLYTLYSIHYLMSKMKHTFYVKLVNLAVFLSVISCLQARCSLKLNISCWGQLTTKGTDSSEGALKIYISILHCPVYSDLTIATIVCSILDVFSIKSKVILLISIGFIYHPFFWKLFEAELIV